VNHFPWLSLVTFLPLAGGLVLAVLPRVSPAFSRWWALGVTLATFVASLAMLSRYDGSQAGYQLVDRATWVSSLRFEYHLGIDGISLFLVLITTFLLPIAVLASWRGVRSQRLYFVSFLILETAILGCFVSLDLLLFFVFFEALLVPMYLIVGGWGGEHRAYAAIKFFIFTMGGSAFLLAAILFLYFKDGTFDVTTLATMPLPATTARWLWLGFFVAFAVKVPLVPLHVWQPDAYTEAPVAGTLVLAALLAKVGAYGLIRFNLTLFPDASAWYRDFALVLAVLAVLYGAVCAVVQTDLKRLVAYSSLSHMGFIVLGIFAFTVQAASGSVLYMVNHALSTGALFLLVGMLAQRIGTNDLRRMGGLGAKVPVLAGVFLFMALASVGLPGLNNFVSEFLVILGTFSRAEPYAVAAVVAVVLAAIYLLWAYQRAFHGVPAIAGGAEEPVTSGNGHPAHAAAAEGWAGLLDLRGIEYAIVVPLIAAVLFLGVYPNPVLSRIEPASGRTVRCVTGAASTATTAVASTATGAAASAATPISPRQAACAGMAVGP
jgi:NADH-quinone oxidoreductase subunit M